MVTERPKTVNFMCSDPDAHGEIFSIGPIGLFCYNHGLKKETIIRDPERFIREKLTKKNLSPNTLRDLLMAALLVTLQQKDAVDLPISELADWQEAKAAEIRHKASQVFARIDAPFEYPTRAQLVETTECLKTIYRWERLPQKLRQDFEDVYGLILSKFPEEK